MTRALATDELGSVLRQKAEEVTAEHDRLTALIALRRHDNDDHVTDVADTGTHIMDLEEEELLLGNLRRQMEQLTLALTLFEAGEYGRCQSCEQPIAVERLMALPAATLCIACQEQRERR